MTTYFAPLLHLYQPSTQDIEVLKRINKECYEPLFKVIEQHENAKFTININGVLIEKLYEYDLDHTIDLLRDLVSENKVEIVGTGMYHPILPLIPEKEINRQIRMNEELNKREFGNMWKREGFFPPELAISPEITKIVGSLGYDWILVSGIACPVKWPFDRIYKTDEGLKIFFRDDIISNKISFKKISAKEFITDLKEMHKNQKDEKRNDTYIISAMDGETFGHHIPNYEKTFLSKMLDLLQENKENNEEKIEITFISELEDYFPIAEKSVTPRRSSWSTSYEDLVKKIYYPLWKKPDNKIHKYYWKIMKSLNQLMNIADNLDLTKDWEVENYYNTARYYYDKGLYSCPVWWANPQNDSWSPNLIHKGIELLMRAALNAQLAVINAGVNGSDGYFDSISYYHGLLLMEIYSVSKKKKDTPIYY
jgi:alpha-amylase/alpha-mannosidase (GH57 family)